MSRLPLTAGSQAHRSQRTDCRDRPGSTGRPAFAGIPDPLATVSFHDLQHGKDQQLRNDEEKPEPDGEAIAAWLDAIGNR